MTAKEYLNDIRKADIELTALKLSIDRMREQAQGVRAMQLSDMPKGGLPRGADDVVAEIVDMQHDVNRRALALCKMQREALRMIMQLTVTEQRTVLIRRYLCAESWDDIVDGMHYAYSGIFKLHGAALQAFARVFDKEWRKVE